MAVKRSLADRMLQKKKKKEARAGDAPDDAGDGEFEFGFWENVTVGGGFLMAAALRAA